MTSIKYKKLKKGTDGFPKKLYDLEVVPTVLYVLGDASILDDFAIAVVGSRNCTLTGQKSAINICDGLSKSNINIVSGFAVGVDAIAHTSSINNKSKTIAVLGSGFNYFYPEENKYLVDKIIENGGAIISEYPPDTMPFPQRFVARDRIIAALSDGVVVIEAGVKSGSMVTAKCANVLNRKLFVLPGSVDEHNYKGSNMLLKNGAKFLLSYEDILDEYEIKEKHNEMKIPNEYKDIFNTLREPKNINQIARELKQDVSTVSSSLTLMEISGFIKSEPGNIYKRIM